MDQARSADSLSEHKAIVQAVIRQDADAAEHLARNHIHQLLQWVSRAAALPAAPLRPLSSY